MVRMLMFYQYPFSHWCVKVQKIMDYKGVEYEPVRVGYHDKRELLQATGQDYVPALVNNKQVVTYAGIPDYLENLKPSPTIYPNGTKAVSKAIENWAHYRLEEIVWRVVVPDVPKTFKDDLERWVFVEIQELKRGPLELVEQRRSALRTEMNSHLQIVEDMLKQHPYLLAESPSLADFAVYGAVNPIPFSGNTIPQEFPKLASWFKSISDL
jgi:glutathione S-transferase